MNSTDFTQTLPLGTKVGSAVQYSEVKPTTQEDAMISLVSQNVLLPLILNQDIG